MVALEAQHCNRFGTTFQLLSSTIVTHISIHPAHVSCNLHLFSEVVLCPAIFDDGAADCQIAQELAEIHVHFKTRG